MTSLSQLQSTLGEILDSTASLVQGRGRGGADGSLTWVDVVGGKRVQAKCFGRVAPGTCGVVQDRTGQWWAIGQGQGSVQTEQVQFYRHRARPTSTPESADVAVLLSCEKEDKYEYWITYLGNDRKDKFAFVGELPKVLQTEQYWAWESNQGGRFEFNPYTGATGGGIAISTTPTNHDGAVIDAGPSGAFYQSEGWNGGGDKGGVVTPRWTKVLSDYEVTARTYLQTLCYPLTQYTDVTWEWSDGGGGYALRKVPGDNVTTDSGDKKLGTRWVVNWSYEGGGGSVGLAQEESPRVTKKMTKPDEEIELEEGKTKVWIVEWEEGREVFFTKEDDILTVNLVESVSSILVLFETTLPDVVVYGTSIGGYSGTVPEGEVWSITRADSIWGSQGEFFYGVGSVFAHIRNHVSLIYIGNSQINGSSQNWHWQSKYNYPPLWQLEVKINGSTSFISDKYRYQPSPGIESYSIDPEDPDPNPPPGYSYSIQVFDKDGVEVASDSASSPISHTTKKYETKRVDFFIRQDGENINGRFDASTGPLPGGFEDGDDVPEEWRKVEIEDGESAPGVTGETNLITAKVEAWVEVNEKELAKIYLDGKDGQNIVESSAYEEATKPYTGPDGRTVFPCYPQKTEDNPLKEEKKSFQRGEGFNAYHTTFYASYDESGDLVEWTPFDFGNPDLSGYLPSPSVNYLYSLISTDLLVSYDSVARLSWGADIPEENPETGETTNLEEEQIDGIDKNGVLYPLVKGFTYGLYGPIKASNILLNQRIDKQAGQSLANYDMNGWNYRNRARKPRTYVLGPDDFEEGEPFEEFDVSDLNQRGLNQMQMTMGTDFRQSLWGYDLGPIGNEREEDWRHQAATFANVTSGGSTPNQRRFFNDPAFNSSNVRQSGDKRVDIKVNMDDVKALLKAAERKDVRFTVYPEGGGDDAEPTEKIFKMNPIQDVFEGYDEVKVLAVAGIIY